MDTISTTDLKAHDILNKVEAAWAKAKDKEVFLVRAQKYTIIYSSTWTS